MDVGTTRFKRVIHNLIQGGDKVINSLWVCVQAVNKSEMNNYVGRKYSQS